jgi:hypothetical protein
MWLLALGAAALALWAYRSWPHGADPFAGLPAGIGAKAGSTDVTVPESGRVYTVTTYQAPAGQARTFHVAVQKSLPNWIRYYQDWGASGARTLEKAYTGGSADGATDAQILAGLRKDFAVQ